MKKWLAWHLFIFVVRMLALLGEALTGIPPAVAWKKEYRDEP